jgi:hypothetical protein
MTEEDRDEAELKAGKDREHQQGKTGDDAGKNEREKNETAEDGFSWEISAVEGESGEKAKGKRKEHCGYGDEEAVEERIPDGRVAEELAIPIESEMFRRKSADTVLVEGIEDQNGDGEIEERKDD